MFDPSRVLLIGVDGGATNVRAHHVHVDTNNVGDRFYLGQASSQLRYPPSDFVPIPLQRQLDDQGAGRMLLSSTEAKRGSGIAATMAQAVINVARESEGSADQVILGIAMPGLKTAEGRGIAVLNNGPRMPSLAKTVETSLEEAGIVLVNPIHRLGSDGDYCGMGEQFALDGLFRDVDHAYYLGGGTGLAESLKLGGKLVTFDQSRSWIAKAWQMQSTQGNTFEQVASAKAINDRYREQSRTVGSTSSSLLFPEELALQGDPLAKQALASAAQALAELIYERITCVFRGRSGSGGFSDTSVALDADHEYRGILIDRIVLGQQTGRIYSAPRFATVFRNELDRSLSARIREDRDEALKDRYLSGGDLRPGIVVPSQLSAAAALGAAITAVQVSAEFRVNE